MRSHLILSRALSLFMVATFGCGGRSMGAGDSDGGIRTDALTDALPDAQTDARSDGATADPCAPMDASGDLAVVCREQSPRGYAWDGTTCVAIWCACQGDDCGALYVTENLCWAARAPACLPAHACLNQPYESCTERADCQVVWYGGGCFDLDTCSAGGPDSDNWLCWEQGIACVPADHPCTQRSRGDCDGACYWWEQSQEVCFEACCLEESYGYCAPVPAQPPDCAPQEIGFCPDACADLVGYRWDGEFCRPVTCCCEGADCGDMYLEREGCVMAHWGCSENACSETGGYCDYGDFVEPTCLEGYGKDWQVVQEDPDACGMGVCCAPCPDPNAEGVWYLSTDPLDCLAADWDCFDDNLVSFENECGCGCRPL